MVHIFLCISVKNAEKFYLIMFSSCPGNQRGRQHDYIKTRKQADRILHRAHAFENPLVRIFPLH